MPPRSGYRTCTKCQRDRADRFFVSQRGRVCSTCRRRRVQGGSREQRLKDTYGITAREYDEILAAQGGVCAITGSKPRGNLDVDHDHKLERELLAMGVEPGEAARASVRGVLSRSANRRLLPAAKDQVAILQRAIDYLTNPPARRILSASPSEVLDAVDPDLPEVPAA